MKQQNASRAGRGRRFTRLISRSAGQKTSAFLSPVLVLVLLLILVFVLDSFGDSEDEHEHEDDDGAILLRLLA